MSNASMWEGSRGWMCAGRGEKQRETKRIALPAGAGAHLGLPVVFPRTFGAAKPGVRGVRGRFAGANGEVCGVALRRLGVAAVGVAAIEALQGRQ